LTSLESSQSTGYYLENGGDLYIRPVSTKQYNNSFSVQWKSAHSWPTLDSDLDGKSDQAEAIAGTNAFDFSAFAFDNSEFTEAKDYNDWTKNMDINNFNVFGGALKGSIINSAPQLYKTDFRFHGNSVLQVRVRYKNNSDGTVYFSWGSSVNNNFNTMRQLSATYTGAGEWQELVFDLGREPEWLDHTITSLRIDPNGTSGDFEIDYIRGVGPGETDYYKWASRWYGNDLSDPFADANSNGLSNHYERLWGMDPFVASRNSAIILPLDQSLLKFTYTRRNVELSGAHYSVWVSTDLTTWTKDTEAEQYRESLINDIETIRVSLSKAWNNHDKLFIQVRATE
jgi:hypothetical protein